MLRTINIGTLVLAFVAACVVDSYLARLASVMACVLGAFSLGMDFAEEK